MDIMHLAQALPKPNLLKTKGYWLKMAVSVATAVIITVMLTTQIVNAINTENISQSFDNSPGTYTYDVLTGPIILNTKGQYLTGFNVPDDAVEATLWGNYSVGQNGTYSNTATMTIWSQKEIINYFSGKSAVPCYNKDMYSMKSDSLNITLTKGNYIILIGGNSFNTSVLEANLYLTFTAT
jgi:hypothetical protein